MASKYIEYKELAMRWRNKGFTYGEIIKKVGINIPKSTLSEWFRDLKLSTTASKRLNDIIGHKIKIAQFNARKTIRKNRIQYLDNVANRVKHLGPYMKNKDVAKIALAMIYFGEGAKNRRGSLMLGNSDVSLIKLFLDLLKFCYNIDESKFRCTLQCRADQNIPKLERFWSGVTKIPKKQFYKARIDPRTIGRKSKKPEYKGVCRIDYFSADIFNELKIIIEIICKMGL